MPSRLHLALLSIVAGLLLTFTLSAQTSPAPATRPAATSTTPAKQAGVLDFRFAVLPSEIANDLPAVVDPATPVKVNGTIARWFEIHPSGIDNLKGGIFVMSSRNAVLYILCYDDHDHTLTHADPQRKPWSVAASNPYANPDYGYIMLPFKLDATGGTYMGEITEANKGHPMAILLDDRAISAPTIQSKIGDSGMISFRNRTASGAEREAEEIKQIMDAATRPATVPATH